jgi:hypothetical protein
MATAKVYGSALTQMMSGGINFATDTIKCSLHPSTYVPNQDTDDFWNDCTPECTGTAYTTGGATLSGKTLTYNSSTNTLTIDANDPAWTGATISGIRYAVFYKSTGTAGTSPLIAYIDFTTDQAVTGANLNIVLPATGLVQLTVA